MDICLHTLIITQTKAFKTDLINVRHENIYHQIWTRIFSIINVHIHSLAKKKSQSLVEIIFLVPGNRKIIMIIGIVMITIIKVTIIIIKKNSKKSK